MKNDKIEIAPFTSDHEALVFTVSIKTSDKIHITNSKAIERLLYKTTKWKVFYKILKKYYNNSIPSDRNLTIHEIDQSMKT